MATIEAIQKANKFIADYGVPNTDPITGKPKTVDLKFFRIESCVKQSELATMSIDEQCRHRQEDKLIGIAYGPTEAQRKEIARVESIRTKQNIGM